MPPGTQRLRIAVATSRTSRRLITSGSVKTQVFGTRSLQRVTRRGQLSVGSSFASLLSGVGGRISTVRPRPRRVRRGSPGATPEGRVGPVFVLRRGRSDDLFWAGELVERLSVV